MISQVSTVNQKPEQVVNKSAKAGLTAAGIAGLAGGALNVASSKLMLKNPGIYNADTFNSAKEMIKNFDSSEAKMLIDDIVAKAPKCLKKATEKILTPNAKRLETAAKNIDIMADMVQTGKVNYKYCAKNALKTAGKLGLIVGGVALAVNTIKAVKANKAEKAE